MMNKKVWVPVVIASSVIILLICFVLCLIFFFLNNHVIVINGNAMSPTLNNNDKKKYVETKDIKRYDIVVYKGDTSSLVRRVYALPNETVEIKGGKIYVNDKVINRDNVHGEINGYAYYVLNNDEYFVMGDNLDSSLDSRQLGPITKDQIKGIIK